MLSSALLLSACLVGIPGSAPADDGPGCAHAKTASRLLAGAPGAPGAPGGVARAGLDDTDALHYHLDIELNPDTEWIGGSNTMTIKSLVDGLSVFRFRLDDVFAIGTVTVDGAAANWNRVDGATVDVTLSPARDSGAVFDVDVAYSGNPAGGGFGSIEFRTRGGADEIWTLSEPWYAYTWWPGKDDSRDKTTADLWFTVPDSMVVASNGVLLDVVPVSGNKLRYEWQTNYQTADYLYCIGATNYNQFDEVWNYDGYTMPLNFYLYPEDDNGGNRAAWRENLDMLDVFSDHYGIYPFVEEKYGMCQVGFGGGMEHQTMTSQGGFWESITAHELGHQWFGDMITCATWHDIWLNEGFATYSEAIWYGNKPGSSGMPAYHQRMEDRRPSEVDDSVYVYDISNVGRIFSGNFTYRKAAWVVHMLRHVLGDEVFFDTLAAYRNAYEYNSATTDDFQAVVENISGRDMTWFFDEWIYEIGAPSYRRAWREHVVGGRHFIELYLRQVQSGSYPIFQMPIDVATSGPGGDATTVVWNDEAAEHLLFETSGAVSTLDLDPDVWILEIGNSTTSFVEGPPKIIATAPEPGSTVESSETLAVEITFHKDVVVSANQFTLVGDVTGALGFTFGYVPGTQAVTLTPDGIPPADTYTLTVDDGIVDVVAGLALDGELSDAIDPASLPSGEGLPGGDGVVRFTLTGGVPGDVTGDGLVNFADILAVLAAWGPCAGCPEDLDGSGAVDFADLLVILGNWS